MNKLVEELRLFGEVNFDDSDVHARWELPKYNCKFTVSFEDISLNVIGCRLLTFTSRNVPVDMRGQYIIGQDTSRLLGVALRQIISDDVITPEQFCEAFIEFRSHDEYTDLLRHTRYMNFLEKHIGSQEDNARKVHDELCSHGYIPTYDGSTLSTIGDIDGENFTFQLHVAGDKSKAVIIFNTHIYEMTYIDYQSVVSMVKKFISMVNSS
jgi:hypothetical protein